MTRLKTAGVAMCATVGIVLSACTFGPKGTPPEVASPAHYGVEPQVAQTVSAEGVAQVFVVSAKPVPEWWKAYQSDALDALVDEGLRNSLTLAAADKTLAAAKEQYRAQVGSSMLPTIDAGGQAVRERSLTLPGLGPPTALYDVFAGQFQVQYTFDFFGAARLADRALAAQVDNQSWQLDAARRALAANIVTALQTIVSRNMEPIQGGVVSIGHISGGDAYNILPERVVMKGTARWFRRAKAASSPNPAPITSIATTLDWFKSSK